MKWEEIVPLLPKKAGYNDLEIGTNKKRVHIARYLPDLMAGESKVIVDVGAGCGFFCRVCMDLGHTATAVLHPKGQWPHGFQEACRFLGVPFKVYNWGSAELPFERETCDVVNSEGMIGMNAPEEWEKILDDMLYITKPGGTVLLLVNQTRAKTNRHIITDWARSRPVEIIREWDFKWKWKKLRS